MVSPDQPQYFFKIDRTRVRWGADLCYRLYQRINEDDRPLEAFVDLSNPTEFRQSLDALKAFCEERVLNLRLVFRALFNKVLIGDIKMAHSRPLVQNGFHLTDLERFLREHGLSTDSEVAQWRDAVLRVFDRPRDDDYLPPLNPYETQRVAVVVSSDGTEDDDSDSGER